MRLLMEFWVAGGFLTYVADPFGVIYGSKDALWERLLTLFLCVIAWPIAWVIVGVEWYTRKKWE